MAGLSFGSLVDYVAAIDGELKKRVSKRSIEKELTQLSAGVIDYISRICALMPAPQLLKNALIVLVCKMIILPFMRKVKLVLFLKI